MISPLPTSNTHRIPQVALPSHRPLHTRPPSCALSPLTTLRTDPISYPELLQLSPGQEVTSTAIHSHNYPLLLPLWLPHYHNIKPSIHIIIRTVLDLHLPPATDPPLLLLLFESSLLRSKALNLVAQDEATTRMGMVAANTPATKMRILVLSLPRLATSTAVVGGATILSRAAATVHQGRTLAGAQRAMDTRQGLVPAHTLQEVTL
jgi:hypothetical protein